MGMHAYMQARSRNNCSRYLFGFASFFYCQTPFPIMWYGIIWWAIEIGERKCCFHSDNYYWNRLLSTTKRVWFNVFAVAVDVDVERGENWQFRLSRVLFFFGVFRPSSINWCIGSHKHFLFPTWNWNIESGIEIENQCFVSGFVPLLNFVFL